MSTRTNKVVRVNFAGGILGLIFGSHKGKLEGVINKQNAEGWNLAEVIPDNLNIALILIRLILLILTLGLWTFSTGYLLVFERPASYKADVPTANIGLRTEPRMSAK
jgi:hypothetical protein